jgi:hypothetical protein
MESVLKFFNKKPVLIISLPVLCIVISPFLWFFAEVYSLTSLWLVGCGFALFGVTAIASFGVLITLDYIRIN